MALSMGHLSRSRYSPFIYFKLVFVLFLFICYYYCFYVLFLFIKFSGIESPSFSFLASYLGQTVNG